MGYEFHVGQDYLVVSNQDGARYKTGACSRTGRIDSEDVIEDLKAVRTWKSGNPLQPRIYGRVQQRDLNSSLQVHLLHDGKVLSIGPAADGRFSFDDLEKKRYTLAVEDARGSGKRVIDLSRFRCFEAIPWFGDKWEILGGPLELPVS